MYCPAWCLSTLLFSIALLSPLLSLPFLMFISFTCPLFAVFLASNSLFWFFESTVPLKMSVLFVFYGQFSTNSIDYLTSVAHSCCDNAKQTFNFIQTIYRGDTHCTPSKSLQLEHRWQAQEDLQRVAKLTTFWCVQKGLPQHVRNIYHEVNK